MRGGGCRLAAILQQRMPDPGAIASRSSFLLRVFLVISLTITGVESKHTSPISGFAFLVLWEDSVGGRHAFMRCSGWVAWPRLPRFIDSRKKSVLEPGNLAITVVNSLKHSLNYGAEL